MDICTGVAGRRRQCSSNRAYGDIQDRNGGTRVLDALRYYELQVAASARPGDHPAAARAAELLSPLSSRQSRRPGEPASEGELAAEIELADEDELEATSDIPAEGHSLTEPAHPAEPAGT